MKELASGTERQIFGRLGSVSLNDIIQLLGMSRRTATLELRRGDERGRVYFRNGQIIHATAGLYEGEESFIELLGWGDADFSVEEGIDSLPKISITKSTEALLLSTMTALDEVARVRTQIGRPPIQVAPTITEKRIPPRPRPRQPTRSLPKRALLLVGGLIAATGLAVATIAILPTVPAVWTQSPWHNLPSVDAPPTLGGMRASLPPPDAWAIANTVWERPALLETEPPPPRPPRAEAAPLTTVPAYLTVVVEPWARVRIDGAAVGETPLGRLELPAGTHQITLSNDHIVGVIRDEIVIEPGQSVTRRYSFNDTGYVRLVVTPWADVSVDGRAIGQTPLGQVAVPAGPHSIRFVHPELGQTERAVTVVSGQTTLVKVQLQ